MSNTLDRYTILARDIKDAADYARRQSADVDDGGTCNFDGCVILLPRWSAGRVIDAAEAAGLFCSKGYYRGRCGEYTLDGSGNAQGYRRTAFAKALCGRLAELGYNTFVRYIID